MNENLKTFLDAIQINEELKEKVGEIDKKVEEEPEERMDEYIAVAKEYGFTITKEDFSEEENHELSEDELQAVSGGLPLYCGIVGVPSQGEEYRCFCFVGGGGKGGCGCAVVGASGVSF